MGTIGTSVHDFIITKVNNKIVLTQLVRKGLFFGQLGVEHYSAFKVELAYWHHNSSDRTRIVIVIAGLSCISISVHDYMFKRHANRKKQIFHLFLSAVTKKSSDQNHFLKFVYLIKFKIKN
ncbi:hypothetical protein BpHYR1_027200 [Brachionus plicatilis]|uniref:Uncharacterized protein n=1 Tax=Brachionus plicatilis TaxID=10195 RepID=A0A3M7P7B0_BRAPC|nr:hypothetical protein BpHYR1_027200 [Brachionus plicatilis]